MTDEIIESSPPSKFAGLFPTVEKLTRWAEGVKSASVTLLAAGTASIASVGMFNAVTSDSVSVEPIKVPAPFEERGFSSEITTARLLDEITTYQQRSSSAKERVSILSKGQSDDLEKLQASVGGIDVRHVQQAVQDTLGIKKQKITGEITFRKNGDDTVYNVRLRRLPGNQVLLDITVRGDPETVLKKTALAMIEVFDPHIAASIYWREKDEENALRMIDVVLGNDRVDDDKYSLNLRGYIHITHKRYDAAQKDYERIMQLDSKFAPAHGMAAWLRRAQGDLEASLREANTTIELAPTKWYGYIQKAQTLRDMKRLDQAEEQFTKAISLNPDAPTPYLLAGQFMVAANKPSEAEIFFRKGLLKYADNAPLHVSYGEFLKKQGDPERAGKEFSKALELDPKNTAALNGKADLEQLQPLKKGK